MLWENAIDQFAELLLEDENFRNEHGGTQYNVLLAIFIGFYLLFGLVFYRLQFFLKEYEKNERHHAKKTSDSNGIRESRIKESEVELKQSIMSHDGSNMLIKE